MEHWFNGLPYQGVSTSNDNGSMDFWFDGQPNGYIFPAAAGAQVKVINGVTVASDLKTVNGLAKASIKEYNGLNFN